MPPVRVGGRCRRGQGRGIGRGVARAPIGEIDGRGPQRPHPPGAQMLVEHLQRAAGEHGQPHVGECEPVVRGGRRAEQLPEAVDEPAPARGPLCPDREDLDDRDACRVGVGRHRLRERAEQADEPGAAAVRRGRGGRSQGGARPFDDRLPRGERQVLLAAVEPVQRGG